MAASITPSTTTFTGSLIFLTVIAAAYRPRAGPDHRLPWCCALPMPTCFPYDFSDFHDTMHKYDDELKKLLKDQYG